MTEKELASTLLMLVGGKQNIVAVEHCMTRLRFNLKDSSQADTQKILNIQGIISVVDKGGQYQIVIGNTVKDVYKEFIKLGDFQNNEISDEKKGIVNKILDTISGIFIPIVPALAGAGMLKALLALLTMLKVVAPDSQTYQFLNFMGDSVFYFMPIIIAASASKKFHVNQFVAMGIGAILMHPTFMNMIAVAKESQTGLEVFGLPVSLVSYSSSVIPIILAIWFMSYVEPITDRYMPKSIRIFMTPLITMLVVGIATLVAIGPLGNICGQLLGDAIGMLNHYVSWLVPLLVGTFTPLMVMTGMHYGLIPIGINLLATTGFDTVAGPGMMVSNIAQGGASLAVAFRCKNTEIKSLAASAGISAVCGITEPAMYGISLRFKKPLIAAMIGGGAAGLFIGIMGVGRYAQVSPGLFALPSFLGEKGISNLIYAIIGCAIAFIVSFIISFILGIDEPKEDVKLNEQKEIKLDDEEIFAPLKGQVISLDKVNDSVFSSGSLGKGMAIIPSEGKIYAPADGTISAFFETGHAIGVTSKHGAEILIHVGIDTVNLKGKYFYPKVKQNEQVKKGELLLEFDLNKMKEEGYDCTTMIIVTNSQQYTSVQSVKIDEADKNKELMILTI
ncbi:MULTISPECIES: beta-glucoside-specific PTS transporter subunit IIABC [Bacillota]|jgi:beta-glucoside PTS system EIICBA component|uniref:PTS glucose transporter subunit IIA n=3 Tax=Amedibacillus TaxID=2749846 RepID=A0A7G9GQ64_9FIRM|nr:MULTISPECIES: beta-glucoside-specific PTS transporter subunit IIABC [Bacillota]QNM12946.1 PTS glucose transporter subunit IIA [[Eubacterium] hominis]MCH4287530.1 beta-glucoside-specific PTS transporter subunit IIABC [Amedibacillus hominis]RGB48544.1 PTS beta-glucoside transporter subunit EIIBCA [Absiella sp. AM22-9]RGB52695.1 PTS beta-glucoside transporter subunit EIIBCA [Absiella sp. AM10-20]RGB62611.1 PTS beta-glucoside transporter subunit EIIBCA [Absiella sp. AM09-45]